MMVQMCLCFNLPCKLNSSEVRFEKGEGRGGNEIERESGRGEFEKTKQRTSIHQNNFGKGQYLLILWGRLSFNHPGGFNSLHLPIIDPQIPYSIKLTKPTL